MADIENAYIFVADALRWDFLPDRVTQYGTPLKTVASSTLSPTSFASITSGLYPPTHGVWTFGHSVSEHRNWLLETDGVSTSFWQDSTDDPLYATLGQDPEESRRVDEMEPPFINVERELLTHSPYGVAEDETGESSGASSFLDDHTEDLSDLRDQYARGARRAASVFEPRLDALAERGLLDETLVIFTSDHGEFLGEHGSLSHVYPVAPESVYVPTVFVHPEEISPRAKSAFSHVDITATIADVLDIDVPYDTPGTSVYSRDDRSHAYSGFELPAGYGAFGESDSSLEQFPSRVHSLWNSSGGWVFDDSSRASQMSNLLKYAIPTSRRQRNVFRQNASGTLSLAAQTLRQTTSFGDPGLARDEARQMIDSIPDAERTSATQSLNDEQLDRLRDLGYR